MCPSPSLSLALSLPLPLRAYVLLLIRFVPAAILDVVAFFAHMLPYPYPITHMPQMSVHQCRVCAQMGYMHALQHIQCMLHSLLSLSLSLYFSCSLPHPHTHKRPICVPVASESFNFCYNSYSCRFLFRILYTLSGRLKGYAEPNEVCRAVCLGILLQFIFLVIFSFNLTLSTGYCFVVLPVYACVACILF